MVGGEGEIYDAGTAFLRVAIAFRIKSKKKG